MKALLSLVVLLLFTQQSFGADCSVIVDTLARLKCFGQAADAKLPRPKGAASAEQATLDKRARKMGAMPIQ